MKITAAVARAPQVDFSIEHLELEEPKADEVLVRIVGVGLCHTDLIARDQHIPVPLPAVLGHEGSGVIEQVGAEVTKVKPGDRVVLSFHSCGSCERCNRREPCYCHSFLPLNFSGARPDGSRGIRNGSEPVSGRFFGQSSFASHALANQRNVVKVEGDARLELLGPLGCGFQTGAGSVMRALDCQAGSSIAIFGGGAVGIAAVMAAKVRGCKSIVLVEPLASRRALAQELGATHAIDPAQGEVVATVWNILPTGANYVFDSTGIQAIVEQGLACLGLRGTCGLVAAATPDTVAAANLTGLVVLGQTIKGIIEGDSDPDTFIPELIRLYQEGKFPLEKVVTTFPLSQINEAIAAQKHGECLKAVLLP